MSTAVTAPEWESVTYAPRGASKTLMTCHDPEVLISGPAGTGKTLSLLYTTVLRARIYPGSRHLILRKTLVSLKASAIVTLDERIRPTDRGARFYGEGRRSPRFVVPTDVSGPDSEIVLGGLDRPSKTLSTDYDTIVCFECNELTEGDWETLTRALRHGAMPYQQIVGDCNPDTPEHWLRKRVASGRLTELVSAHEDNPRLHDGTDWTEEGKRYLSVLDALTGVRYLRLRLGQWAAAEGMIYADAWSEQQNLINHFRPPLEWTRYISVDFGHTHPFVAQWWAEDPDGRLYLYRELYRTQELVEDHARAIRELSGWGGEDGTPPQIPRSQTGRVLNDADPLPRAIYCDHDAEGRATLERHLGLYTTGAYKAVREGIDAVAARMRAVGDGRPRLLLMRDARVRRDETLAHAKLPTCTAEEIPGYVWDLAHSAAAAKEQPVKENDHGVDAMRYLVASLDCRQSQAQWGPKIW